MKKPGQEQKPGQEPGDRRRGQCRIMTRNRSRARGQKRSHVMSVAAGLEQEARTWVGARVRAGPGITGKVPVPNGYFGLGLFK